MILLIYIYAMISHYTILYCPPIFKSKDHSKRLKAKWNTYNPSLWWPAPPITTRILYRGSRPRQVTWRVLWWFWSLYTWLLQRRPLKSLKVLKKIQVTLYTWRFFSELRGPELCESGMFFKKPPDAHTARSFEQLSAPENCASAHAEGKFFLLGCFTPYIFRVEMAVTYF